MCFEYFPFNTDELHVTWNVDPSGLAVLFMQFRLDISPDCKKHKQFLKGK
jgi:hypothetical protein